VAAAIFAAVLGIIFGSIGFNYERLTLEAHRQIGTNRFTSLHSVVCPIWMGLASHLSFPLIVVSGVLGYLSVGWWWPVGRAVLWLVFLPLVSSLWLWPGPAEGLAIMIREATRRRDEALRTSNFQLGAEYMMLIIDLEGIGKPKTVDDSPT